VKGKIIRNKLWQKLLSPLIFIGAFYVCCYLWFERRPNDTIQMALYILVFPYILYLLRHFLKVPFDKIDFWDALLYRNVDRKI
jgi:hypothetical protein